VTAICHFERMNPAGAELAETEASRELQGHPAAGAGKILRAVPNFRG
jgi:hypothetical protein